MGFFFSKFYVWLIVLFVFIYLVEYYYVNILVYDKWSWNVGIVSSVIICDYIVVFMCVIFGG